MSELVKISKEVLGILDSEEFERSLDVEQSSIVDIFRNEILKSDVGASVKDRMDAIWSEDDN